MKSEHAHRRRIAVLVVFLALCAGLYIWIYVIPGISGALTRTAIVSHGHLRVTDETEGYVIRNERVISAGQSGGISYYTEEGIKTRKGAKVLDVYPTQGSAAGYYAGHTGVISYYIDGYEEYFTPETMDQLEPGELADLVIEPENTHRAQTIAGEPLYKIVLDDMWYVAVPVPEERAGKYAAGAAVALEFGDRTVPAVAMDVIKKQEGWLVLIRTDRYYEPFASIRKVALTVVTEDYEGLIVPNTSIAMEEGVPGVYVRDLTGAFHFTRIKVITTDGKDSLIHSGTFSEADESGEQKRVNTVEIYDEILRHSETKE